MNWVNPSLLMVGKVRQKYYINNPIRDEMYARDVRKQKPHLSSHSQEM